MEDVREILLNIIKFLTQAGTLLAAIILVILGLRYAYESRSGATEKLRQFLIYVIIGLVLLILSIFIPNMLKAFLEQYTNPTQTSTTTTITN